MLNIFGIDHRARLIEVLNVVVSHLEKSEVSDWTASTPSEVIAKIKNDLELLESGQKIDKEELIVLFLPTSDIQEISMANDWADLCLSLSETFDKLIKKV